MMFSTFDTWGTKTALSLQELLPAGRQAVTALLLGCPSGKLPVKLTGNRKTQVAGPRGRQAQDQVAFGYSHRVHMPVFNVSHEGFGGAERKGSCQCVKT